jgi:chromosome partitioning protein
MEARARSGGTDRQVPGARRKAKDHASIKRSKWLVLGSSKGGSGKTTTALNLAAFATNAGLRVALLDMDTQETLTQWHRRRPAEAPEIALYTIPLVQIARAIERIDSEAAGAAFDLVVVDTPPGIDDRPVQARELVDRADYVLVPTTQGPPDIASVVEWMGFLRREGVKASFLLNRTQRTYASFREARSALLRAGPLCPMDVRQLEDIQGTHKFGVGICEIRRAKGAEDLEGVWNHMRHEMGL